jgi:UDP-N-acetylglucosamine transferase subunit ALG13
MIFVTVGNHFQGFERLLKKVDEAAPRIPHEIVIQKGYSKFVPQNTKYFDFVPMNTAMQYIQKSDLVVSHAGIGTIILCKEYGMPLIIFPRRKKYGEHGTDHQMEIAKAIDERKDDHIFIVYEEDQLEAKIAEVLTKKQKPVPGANVGRTNLIKAIQSFIEDSDLKKTCER